jgi:putative Mn2+ efflux pump MntP
MEIVTIIFIAFGLAMDALAVSIANAIATKTLRIHNALKMATFFGSFQAFMPLIGWLAGLSLKDFISGFDHWVAFWLLSLIGCKMIYESTKTESRRKENMPLNIYVLLMLSVATSIDALAAGVSFALLKIFIVTPIMLIGTITFLLSFLGASIGNRLGRFFENKIEIAGGIVLISIGIKILIEHLV